MEVIIITGDNAEIANALQGIVDRLRGNAPATSAAPAAPPVVLPPLGDAKEFWKTVVGRNPPLHDLLIDALDRVAEKDWITAPMLQAELDCNYQTLAAHFGVFGRRARNTKGFDERFLAENSGGHFLELHRDGAMSYRMPDPLKAAWLGWRRKG
jgi:hypothetical protein